MKLKYRLQYFKPMPFYVLKLGGSLMKSSWALISALCLLTREGYSFLVVPGGGPMADLVRDLFQRYGISQEAAHWMAILAMEQYAYFLADGTGARLTAEICRSDGLEILLPYQALKENDYGLEHSWDYTSDSVAALAALKLDATMIKATDVEGILMEGKLVEEIQVPLLKGRVTCIDQGSLRLLKGRICWVLNGSDPESFVSALRSGRGGTIIKG